MEAYLRERLIRKTFRTRPRNRVLGSQSDQDRSLILLGQGNCKLMTSPLAIKQTPNIIRLSSSVIIRSSTGLNKASVPK